MDKPLKMASSSFAHTYKDMAPYIIYLEAMNMRLVEALELVYSAASHAGGARCQEIEELLKESRGIK